MSKKLLMIIIAGAVLVGAGTLAYVYRNLQRDANVVSIDQSNFDDQTILEEISAPTPFDSGETTTQPNTTTQQGLPTDSLPSIASPFKSGSFVRYDAAHYAEGTANIYQTSDGPVLKLENFKTSNGPDLFVYLATESDIPSITAGRGEEVSLGKLKQIEGDQVYKLPDDYGKYNSVVIWCRAFNVNFSSASLSNI